MSLKLQILDVLRENALTTPESLSQMLAKSVDEVKQAIHELEEERAILGYKAIIDYDKLEHDCVRAAIEVKITPERDGGFDRIASRISKFQEVHSCYLMSGSYDLLVVVEGKNLRDIASFVSEKLSSVHGVLSTASHFILKPYKEHGSLFIREEREGRLKVAP